jgi:hypothetical protein
MYTLDECLRASTGQIGSTHAVVEKYITTDDDLFLRSIKSDMSWRMPGNKQHAKH